MKPGGHFGALASAVFVRAALLALIAVALPAGAWAASPASDPGTTVVPAIKYAAPGPVPTPQPAPAPISVRVPVQSPVPVASPVPVPRTVSVPRTVTFTVAAPPSDPPYAPTAPLRPGPSADPSPVAVTSPVDGTDYERSASTPNLGARSRTVSVVGSPSTGDSAGSLPVNSSSTVKPDRSPAAGTTGNSRGSTSRTELSSRGLGRPVGASIASGDRRRVLAAVDLGNSAKRRSVPRTRAAEPARADRRVCPRRRGNQCVGRAIAPGRGSASQPESVLTPGGETSWRAATRAGPAAAGSTADRRRCEFADVDAGGHRRRCYGCCECAPVLAGHRATSSPTRSQPSFEPPAI